MKGYISACAFFVVSVKESLKSVNKTKKLQKNNKSCTFLEHS